MPSGITTCICDTGQNDAATALITQYKQTVWCSPKLHSVTSRGVYLWTGFSIGMRDRNMGLERWTGQDCLKTAIKYLVQDRGPPNTQRQGMEIQMQI